MSGNADGPSGFDPARKCPSCRLRKKVEGMDGGGGDFWRCLALPVLPAFTGQFIYGGFQQLVNLASFGDDHPCAEHQNRKSCALWEPRSDSDGSPKP